MPIFSAEPDTKANRERIHKACIVDWENFFDEAGAELTCTPENVVRAGREIEGFNEFITANRKVLAKDVQSEQKDQEKN